MSGWLSKVRHRKSDKFAPILILGHLVAIKNTFQSVTWHLGVIKYSSEIQVRLISLGWKLRTWAIWFIILVLKIFRREHCCQRDENFHFYFYTHLTPSFKISTSRSPISYQYLARLINLTISSSLAKPQNFLIHSWQSSPFLTLVLDWR